MNGYCECDTCVEGRALFVPDSVRYVAQAGGCWHWEWCERWEQPAEVPA